MARAKVMNRVDVVSDQRAARADSHVSPHARAGGVRRPRLLLLAQTLPFPPDSGVNIRVYNVMRMLARTFIPAMLAAAVFLLALATAAKADIPASSMLLVATDLGTPTLGEIR